MEWRFTINGSEIEEPLGFSDIVMRIQREQRWHGIIFEASTSQLGFYGAAFTTLKELKEADGIDAVAEFTAEVRCEGQTEYQTALSGRLNFRSYRERCGDECIIRMNVEQTGCATVFKSRFDQKVNVDSNLAFDGTTVLPAYSALGFDLELPTQELPISAEAYVAEEGDGVVLDPPGIFGAGDKVLIRPVYLNVIDNSIINGNLDQVANFFQDKDNIFFLTPQVLFEDAQSCTFGDFSYNIRLKGSIKIDWSGGIGEQIDISLVVDKWNGVSTSRTLLYSTVVQANAGNGTTYNFDQTYSSTTGLNAGEGIYAYILIEVVSGSGVVNVEIDYNFERVTSFNLSNVKECPPTTAKSYMVHELLSRLAEAITDGCLQARSDYYGRTDSMPFMASEDGCGGLRALTSGLNIRQAEGKDYFLSPQELLDGLRAIDNIGFDIQNGVLRVEPAEWFYRDQEIARLTFLPSVETNIEEQLIYGRIQGGYEKWETRSIKGIDEFNSQKEYRTGVKNASITPLDIRSKLIASGYIIENLRVTTLLNSGDTDSTYDNDTFILQLTRDPYSNLRVEQGGINAPSGFFSPTTIYNWRIRPIYNLMRWFKSIGRNTFFASGQGNYEAKGSISDDCSLESRVVGEDADLDSSYFKNATDATPIWQAESMQFDAPLSVAEYNEIKSAPYGYISVQCATGEFVKAYIRSIEWKPKDGVATFNLIKQWPSA